MGESSDVGRMAEDYLTVVWKAYEWPGGRPSTTDIADQLGVTPSTVSANLRRLARDRLVDYQPYGTVTLTARGEAIAVDLVRRHRIIETYLAERLGLGWDEVHREADRLEHAVSDVVLERMDASLGYPRADPHGDLIPRGDRTDTTAAHIIPLTTVPAGTTVEIVRVSDRSPQILRYLAEKDLRPGTTVEVTTETDETGAVGLRTGATPVEITTTAATALWVQPIS